MENRGTHAQNRNEKAIEMASFHASLHCADVGQPKGSGFAILLRQTPLENIANISKVARTKVDPARRSLRYRPTTFHQVGHGKKVMGKAASKVPTNPPSQKSTPGGATNYGGAWMSVMRQRSGVSQTLSTRYSVLVSRSLIRAVRGT